MDRERRSRGSSSNATLPAPINLLLVCITVNGYSSLSIRYLQQFLTNHLGLSLRIQVLQFDKSEVYRLGFDILLKKYVTTTWDVVGISVYVFNFIESIDLIRFIRDNRLAKRIVLGGPYFSWPTIERCVSAFHHPDYIVVGEGELTLSAIMRSILTGDSLQQLTSQSLSVRTFGTDSHTTSVLQSHDTIQLHEFSPVYSLNDEFLDKEHKAVIDTSRGCCNSCKYCTWGGKILRYYSINKVLSELQVVFSQETAGILFADSNVLSNKQRAKMLLDFIGTENHLKTPIEIFVELGVAGAANVALLKQLATLDCLKIVEVGLQSCSESVCEKIGRRLDFNAFVQQYSSLKRSNNKGFAIVIDLILGLPFSTPVDFLNSLLQVVKLRPDCIHVFLLQVLPGSDIYSNASSYGISYDSESFFVTRTRDIDEENLLWLFCMTAAFSMLFSFPNSFGILCECSDMPALNVVELVANEIKARTTLRNIVLMTGGYIGVFLNPKYYPFFHARLIASVLSSVSLKNSIESNSLSSAIEEEMALNSVK
jgi:radical SAM superfamily enzyme YgiQ (UPF0313 family)